MSILSSQMKWNVFVTVGLVDISTSIDQQLSNLKFIQLTFAYVFSVFLVDWSLVIRIFLNTPICPFCAAKCKAVFAWKSTESTSMCLCLSNFLVISVHPFWAAKCKAVFRWLLPLLTSAPFNKRSSITSARPFWAAMCKTELPGH